MSKGRLIRVGTLQKRLIFLAVILLSKVYLGIYKERKHEEALLNAEPEGEDESK